MAQITHEELKVITQIPSSEVKQFVAMVQEYRKKYIITPKAGVEMVFTSSPYYSKMLVEKDVSSVILESREQGWQLFLESEAEFNAHVMRDLALLLQTPKDIVTSLIDRHIVGKTGDDLVKSVIEVCGEYAGRVYPYIYSLSLSNTQSRRSRAGKTFEHTVYKVYELLGYSFQSQSKVGKLVFQNAGLGKIVDSILPGIEAFKQRRDKTIIGTMKTSLRERWQEVSEEIQRTNIPSIYLLTVDKDISTQKATQMNNHNIVVVAPLAVTKQEKLKDMKNIISFEEYFFEEIPRCLSYWKS